jgi:nitroreductase
MSNNPLLSRRALGASLGASLVAGCGAGSDEYARAAANIRRPLDAAAPDAIAELVRFATLAANGHNTQPWRFERTQSGVDLLPDMSRRTPVVDPDGHHVFVSLGAAAENLLISAPTMGRAGALTVDAAASRLSIALETRTASDDALVAAVPRRQCTRSIYDGRTPSSDELDQIARASTIEGIEVRLLTARPAIDAVRDYVVEANRLQMNDPAFVQELKHWIRFNPQAAIAAGDGLYAASSGNPTLPDWIAPTLFGVAFTVDAETQKYIEQMDSSAGVAVFTGAAATPAAWIEVGRAYQRFALQATLLGVKHAFVNQPIEETDIRSQFASHLGLDDRRPDLVIRFGYAPDLPFSMRRPVSALLSASGP